jgi:hypothetical protein
MAQVLSSTTSASVASVATEYPAAESTDETISLSAEFIWQP